MRDSRRLLATFALVLILGYAAPALCLSAPSLSMSAHVAPCGGCHGHHQHAPAHSCCAIHQLPAAIQASPTPAPLELAVGNFGPENAGAARCSVHASPSRDEVAVSPPAVLRN